MKSALLYSALLFLLLTPVAHAADVPELEEWFSIVNKQVGFGMSYLPDFDTANNGRNALGIEDFNGGPNDPTWYNRYHGDTVNQFTWPSPSVAQISKGDFDGDGIADYLTYDGHIHKGTANGIPPPPTSVAYYQRAGDSRTIPRFIMDINNDGYDDAVINESYNTSKWLMTLLFGGSDLQKLQVKILNEEPASGQNLVGFLPQKSAQGKVRLVTRSFEPVGPFQTPKWVSYVLREMEVHKNGENIEVSFVTLDSITDAAMRPTQSFDMYEGIIHQSRNGESTHFLVPIIGPHKIENYVLDNGGFEKIQQFAVIEDAQYPILYPYPVYGFGSINGDRYTDWIATAGDKLVFYAGRQGKQVDTIPFARAKLKCTVTEAIKIEAIGDVTGDGVGDIAMAFNNDFACFVIYKGVSSHTVSVEEPGPGVSIPPTFSMQQNYPNPVGAERRMTIPVEIQKAEDFTLELYTLDGRKIAELFSGFMPVGKLEFTFDLTQYHLSAGFYSLRMSNGLRLRERGVLLR